MIQPHKVSGIFYPDTPKELISTIIDLLAVSNGNDEHVPKAIISPHAGYIYSGEIAASAYACLSKAKYDIKRVILLAPSHAYPFYGLALPTADYFSTPLGEIEVDKMALNKISSLGYVQFLDAAFAQEHSLEVQLPFLQMQLDDFSLVPIVVGEASALEVKDALDLLWEPSCETLIVVSSDLSHYHSYEKAKIIDEKTAQNIIELNDGPITGEDACGHIPLRGLIHLAKEKKLKPKLIDLRNSGDTSGIRDHVVGYGAFHFYL